MPKMRGNIRSEMNTVDLRLDWCSYQAAKYAVEHWHYSKTMPAPKRTMVGVWEDGKFIGAVVFSWGANHNLSKAFRLEMTECVELARVALNKHRSPVSKILAIAIRMLKKQSPGLRLIVSYADQRVNHYGIIYQAAGWVYSGETADKFDYITEDGRVLHRRSYTGKNFYRAKLSVPVMATKTKSPRKYRYLYPLDAAMRAQIAPLARPYPKRGTGEIDNAPGSNRETGGASPTVPLLKVDYA